MVVSQPPDCACQGSVPAATIVRQLQTAYDKTIARLRDRLAALEPTGDQPAVHRVETLTGCETVAERVPALLDEATDQILYQSPDEQLTEPISQRLTAATERGVTLRLLARSAATRERLQTTVPAAAVIDFPWNGAASPVRLLLIDQETALVSTIQHHSPAEETAIVGSGESNSLVAFLTACVP
jgi:sugar-specific transcriptional regulator TrmB